MKILHNVAKGMLNLQIKNNMCFH